MICSQVSWISGLQEIQITMDELWRHYMFVFFLSFWNKSYLLQLLWRMLQRCPEIFTRRRNLVLLKNTQICKPAGTDQLAMRPEFINQASKLNSPSCGEESVHHRVSLVLRRLNEHVSWKRNKINNTRVRAAAIKNAIGLIRVLISLWPHVVHQTASPLRLLLSPSRSGEPSGTSSSGSPGTSALLHHSRRGRKLGHGSVRKTCYISHKGKLNAFLPAYAMRLGSPDTLCPLWLKRWGSPRRSSPGSSHGRRSKACRRSFLHCQGSAGSEQTRALRG